MGSTSPVNFTLSLINNFCTPCLMFGLEACVLTKSQNNSLSYPYNSAFMKLFSTFDKDVVRQCQYYCGYLPFSYLFDLRVLSFYSNLKINNANPANILFKWFGYSEWSQLADRYKILYTDSPNSFR